MVGEVIKRLVPNFIKVYLRKNRVKHIANCYARRVVNHNYGGFPLSITLADPLGEAWYDNDWLEEPALTVMRQHQLIPGATVFDIGAHQSVVAMMLARIVESNGKVIAVEASEHNAEISRINKANNSVHNLEIIHGAGSDSSGEIEFDQNFNGSVATAGDKILCQKVRAYTVDELASIYGVPQVLVVDVEGFEVNVLKGASKTMQSKPDCYIEIHAGCGLEKFGFSVQDVVSFFPMSDYSLLALVTEADSKQLIPVTDGFSYPSSRFHLIAIAKR